jgi:hypothetical protein
VGYRPVVDEVSGSLCRRPAVIDIAIAALSVAAAVLVAWPTAVQVLPRRGLRRIASRGTPQRRALNQDGVSGGVSISVPMLLDLVAEVLASGASPARALWAVGECLDRRRDPAGGALLRLSDRLSDHLPNRSRVPASATVARAEEILAATLALSVSTGAGPAVLIRAASEEHRRRTLFEQVQAAHRLGVLVLLPTGLCLLPAFVLLTVVPLVLDLVLG